jgi:hypothetical protein
MRCPPEDTIFARLPGCHNPIHVHGSRQRGLFVNLIAHPIDHKSSQSPNFTTVINYAPVYRLAVVSRRGKPGCVDQIRQIIPGYVFFLIRPDGSACPQKMDHLFRAHQPLPADRKTVCGCHAGMIHRTVRTYGRTMTALNAEFSTTIDEGRKGAFVFEFDDLCRTFSNADPIPLAFFLIHGYQAHSFFCCLMIERFGRNSNEAVSKMNF